MTAETRSLLASLYGPAAVISVEPVATPGRSGSFSDVLVADVRLGDRRTRVVVRMCSADGPFRHAEDAARHLLWYSRVAGLPNHPRVLAVAAKDATGQWRPLVGSPTVAVVEEFACGVPYAHELARIRDGRPVAPADVERAAALARYLAGIHRDRRADPDSYLHGLRELVGGVEGLMSVVALYPPAYRLRHRRLLDRLQLAVAERAIDLQHCDRPVVQVHGDFHPGNILFSADGELAVIDRGRIENDEAAVDVGALLINYVSLGFARPELRDPARRLAQTFLDEYLVASGDSGVCTALPVHTAMRAAAVASPTFYPEASERTRIATLTAGIRILREPALRPDNLGVCFAEPEEMP